MENRMKLPLIGLILMFACYTSNMNCAANEQSTPHKALQEALVEKNKTLLSLSQRLQEYIYQTTGKRTDFGTVLTHIKPVYKQIEVILFHLQNETRSPGEAKQQKILGSAFAALYGPLLRKDGITKSDAKLAHHLKVFRRKILEMEKTGGQNKLTRALYEASTHSIKTVEPFWTPGKIALASVAGIGLAGLTAWAAAQYVGTRRENHKLSDQLATQKTAHQKELTTIKNHSAEAKKAVASLTQLKDQALAQVKAATDISERAAQEVETTQKQVTVLQQQIKDQTAAQSDVESQLHKLQQAQERAKEEAAQARQQLEAELNQAQEQAKRSAEQAAQSRQQYTEEQARAEKLASDLAAQQAAFNALQTSSAEANSAQLAAHAEELAAKATACAKAERAAQAAQQKAQEAHEKAAEATRKREETAQKLAKIESQVSTLNGQFAETLKTAHERSQTLRGAAEAPAGSPSRSRNRKAPGTPQRPAEAEDALPGTPNWKESRREAQEKMKKAEEVSNNFLEKLASKMREALEAQEEAERTAQEQAKMLAELQANKDAQAQAAADAQQRLREQLAAKAAANAKQAVEAHRQEIERITAEADAATQQAVETHQQEIKRVQDEAATTAASELQRLREELTAEAAAATEQAANAHREQIEQLKAAKAQALNELTSQHANQSWHRFARQAQASQNQNILRQLREFRRVKELKDRDDRLAELQREKGAEAKAAADAQQTLRKQLATAAQQATEAAATAAREQQALKEQLTADAAAVTKAHQEQIAQLEADKAQALQEAQEAFDAELAQSREQLVQAEDALQAQQNQLAQQEEEFRDAFAEAQEKANKKAVTTTAAGTQTESYAPAEPAPTAHSAAARNRRAGWGDVTTGEEEVVASGGAAGAAAPGAADAATDSKTQARRRAESDAVSVTSSRSGKSRKNKQSLYVLKLTAQDIENAGTGADRLKKLKIILLQKIDTNNATEYAKRKKRKSRNSKNKWLEVVCEEGLELDEKVLEELTKYMSTQPQSFREKEIKQLIERL